MADTELADQLLAAFGSADISLAAQTLADAAVMLMEACESGRYTAALEGNLEMWVALKTLAEKGDFMVPEFAEQLRRLADYVVGETMAIGDNGLATETMTSLISINLQIASGFVDAASKEVVRQTAEKV